MVKALAGDLKTHLSMARDALKDAWDAIERARQGTSCGVSLSQLMRVRAMEARVSENLLAQHHSDLRDPGWIKVRRARDLIAREHAKMVREFKLRCIRTDTRRQTSAVARTGRRRIQFVSTAPAIERVSRPRLSRPSGG